MNKYTYNTQAMYNTNYQHTETTQKLPKIDVFGHYQPSKVTMNKKCRKYTSYCH